MWPTIAVLPDGSEREDVECSCGITIGDACWHDDVVRTDIRREHPGHDEYVIACPFKTGDMMSMVGVALVIGRRAKQVSRRNLEWLLAQPDLPDEFRRAAAVHLRPGTD